jgi:tetratricopeptide (TPR) repeat protein
VVDRWRGTALALLLGIAGLNCAPARADDVAQTRFAEGRAAFDLQDFDAALARFEEALQLGLDTPAVHFNIGAAAYRARRLDRAERAFREVARTASMADLAHYNLGLVALQAGEPDAARRWFTRVATAQDERLAGLAALRLSELPVPRRLPSASYYLRAGAGSDDNVALRPEATGDIASGQRDDFTEWLASASLDLTGTWRFDAGATALRHRRLDDFDQSSVFLGARRIFGSTSWTPQLGIQAAQFSLGGEVFERSVSVSLRGTRQLAGARRLRAQLRGTTVDGRGAYPGLDGARGDLSFDYEWSVAAWNLGAHGRIELTSSEDPTFEYRQAALGFSARWALSPRWTLGTEAGLRRYEYAGIPDGAGSRQETRGAFALVAGVHLHPRVQALLRYEHEDNDSTLDSRDFGRNRLLLSVEAWH